MSGHNYGQMATNQLKAIKEKTGWSKEELSKRLGYNVCYISRWLDGANPRYGRSEIKSLYNAVVTKENEEE